MITDNTLEELRAGMRGVLKHYGVTNTRKPFRCLNPAHEDRHPSMSYDPKTNRVKCFSCGWSGDVFDLIGMMDGAVEFLDRVKRAADIECKQILFEENGTYPRKTGAIRKASKPTFRKPEPIEGESLSEAIREASERLRYAKEGEPARRYITRRGFDYVDAITYGLGLVQNPSDIITSCSNAPKCKDGYICIPFLEFGNRVTFRPVDPNASAIKEFKQKGKRYPIWQESLLREPGTVYVTEGIFDAMAAHKLLDVRAVALCGLGCERLFQVLNDTPKKMRPTVIMALDSDEPGITAACRAVDTLHDMGVKASCINNSGGAGGQVGVYGRGKARKDFNDLLIYNNSLQRPRDLQCL